MPYSAVHARILGTAGYKSNTGYTSRILTYAGRLVRTSLYARARRR